MKALVIDTSKIRHNLNIVKQRAGSVGIYGVLKGNAYGLGLVEMARIMREEGIGHFAVTEPEEASMLRDAGFVEEEILVMRSTSDREEIERMMDINATATIGSTEAAMALNGIAEQRGTVVEAHIKIDTGMGRYGFLPGEKEKILSVYQYMSNIAITGIYTHFHSAFKSEKSVRSQYEAFVSVLDYLKTKDIEVGIRHCANSSAFLRYPFTHMDAVRIGSAVTGRVPGKATYGLKKVGYIESTVSESRWLQKGSTVGYLSAYKVRRPIRIAVIPVGYADGFCVEKARDTYRFSDVVRYVLSAVKRGLTFKRLYVYINGKRARVLGHVSMASTVVDITNIDCKEGDPVFLDAPIIHTAALPRVYVQSDKRGDF